MIFKRIAVYPGTFDPITLGHSNIINRAASLFDKLVIGVTTSTSKTTLFSLKERVNMVKSEIDNNKLKNIQVKSFDGLLVKFVKEEKANTIIRGLRAVADFEYEFQMSFINRTLDSDIETIFLPATENVHFISSSFVKEITRLKGDTKNLVSQEVQNKLVKKFNNV